MITVTPNGVKLALRLAEQLDEVTVFAKEGRCGEADKKSSAVLQYKVMKDLIREVFHSCDALIFFTSTGIAVRMLAPYLQHKAQDPAVVVVDEQGHFAISLLSGHLGGANELTALIADILEATPVITTATDSQGKLAPDALARKLQLAVYPLENIKTVNGALVAGEELSYLIDEAWPDKEALAERLREFSVKARVINEEDLKILPGKKVFFTARRQIRPDTLCITPRVLIAGVGCRKDAPYELIDKALAEARAAAKVTAPVGRIVSTTVKAGEKNLLLWAEKHGIPIEFFDNETMEAAIRRFDLQESNFVKGQIGIGNVCEAAILSYNPRAKIILAKSKFEKVTVSLAWE